MSVEAVTKVASITTGDDKSKSVLMWLAFHLNEKTGLCCPSINLLRKEMEVGSDNTVRAALTRLRERGLVSWTREIEDGVIKRTLYTLHLDASTVAPTSTTEPHSITDVPQPLKGGPSMAEQGSLNGCAGVPQPVNGNKEIEHGIEQGKEQGSVLPAPLEVETPCVDTNPNPAQFEGVPFPDFEETTTDDELFAPELLKTTGRKARTHQSKEEKPKATKTTRGTRLTIETLPDEWRAWMAKHFPKYDPDLVFAEFRDYWIGVSGAKGVKLDWFATFRNHVRGIPEWKQKNFIKKDCEQETLPNSNEWTQARRLREGYGWATTY